MTETSSAAPSSALRPAAMAALWIGAVGTLVLMLRAGGKNRPLILVPLFAVWDLSPFVMLWLAERLSARWSSAARAAVYPVTIAVTIGTLVYYVVVAIWPPPAQPAYPYVIAPPVAWLFIAVALAAVALTSRR